MSTQSTAHAETSLAPDRKLKGDGHSATQAGETTAADLRVRLRNAVESGKTHLTEWKGGFEERVRERPIQSVLIAAAAGAVIGMLLGRRTR